jgi:O-antigen/teichoic acid export membrane protein
VSWARQGLAFGLPLLPGSMSMFSVHFLDRLIIPRFGTVADVGVYAFAYSVALMAVNMATTPLKTIYGNTAYTYYNEGRHDELRQMCRHALGSTVAVALPTTVGLYFLGPALASLLAPEEFVLAGRLMWIVGLGYLAQAVAKVLRVNITFKRGSLRVLGLLLFTSLCNLGLNLLLIPRYGLHGAAWATTAALVAGAVVAAAFAHGDFPLSLDLRPFAWIVLGAASMAGVMIVAQALLSHVDTPAMLMAYRVCWVAWRTPPSSRARPDSIWEPFGSTPGICVEPTRRCRPRGLPEDGDHLPAGGGLQAGAGTALPGQGQCRRWGVSGDRRSHDRRRSL